MSTSIEIWQASQERLTLQAAQGSPQQSLGEASCTRRTHKTKPYSTCVSTRLEYFDAALA